MKRVVVSEPTKINHPGSECRSMHDFVIAVSLSRYSMFHRNHNIRYKLKKKSRTRRRRKHLPPQQHYFHFRGHSHDHFHFHHQIHHQQAYPHHPLQRDQNHKH